MVWCNKRKLQSHTFLVLNNSKILNYEIEEIEIECFV